MKIGLIDVDGHSFPNLALMRISAYHKAQGDIVEWYDALCGGWYDRVYLSKVFSFSSDYDFCIHADEVVRGGTGYAISLVGKHEVYDKQKDVDLPIEIEKMMPDYSIYPQYSYCISMTSRGCPRGCSFCHVAAKEGKCARKVADVEDFWTGQDEIKVCDPNILALPRKDKFNLLEQYMNTKANIEFNQGLDIRLMDDDTIDIINRMRLSKCGLHFAWDNPTDDLESKFRMFSERFRRKSKHGGGGTVYCLTNYEDCSKQEHIDRALYRIYALRDMGFSPYVMVYDKEHADKDIIRLQRWCNNKFVFWSVSKFEDMDFKKA